MRWTSMVAIYALFWAFSVFLVLPFGVRTGQEVGAEHVPGTAESAPHEIDLRRIARRVTIVATVLFALFSLNYRFGWVTQQTLTFFNLEEAG
jgi:predicted secreted protein